MRVLPEPLATHLRQDATTMCNAWRLTRADGVVLGFTDHDATLSFAGTAFSPVSGFVGTEVESGLGLAVDTSEVAGAFSSHAITEQDLKAGRYDGARVELFAVNWMAPAEGRLLMQVFDLGEVSRAGQAFRAELRSMAQQLDAVRGRVYGRRCDANLGDHRCRVALDAPELTGAGTVTAVANGAKLRLIGIESFDDGWFRYGLATWQSGVNEGLSVAVLSHTRHDDGTEIELWSPMADAPQEGDTLKLTAGCDKTFKTCREKFGNGLNFRGFPHLPGSDFAYGYAGENGLHDGSPVVP